MAEGLKLPKVDVENSSIVGRYLPPRRKKQSRRHEDLWTRTRRGKDFKSQTTNARDRPQRTDNSSSNCKDILIDLNSICSVENSSSYRRGFNVKNNTKSVQFTEDTIEPDSKLESSLDTKQNASIVKTKCSRKISKIIELKSIGTSLTNQKKEGRKSKKSKDET